jgi:predicted RNase H-like nuclease (RuvC/YqgF family)
MEIALATIYLKNLDDRIVLAAEARRLRSASLTAQSAEQRAMARRISEIEAENAALHDQLAETEEKLEAMTSIERSIRAQENDGS